MLGWGDLRFWDSSLWIEIQEKMRKEAYFPQKKNVFRALTLTPLARTKVLILGQDPYHTLGAADGLAFSVPQGFRAPPSLVNIIKEVNEDMSYQVSVPSCGPLDGWAKQGVLMINSVWTVAPDKPNSHADWGWQNLTKEIIETVAEVNGFCCFVFWGKHAQTFKDYTYGEGLTIESSHPSPYAANQGFLGSKPFSKINKWLADTGQEPIEWNRKNDYF